MTKIGFAKFRSCSRKRNRRIVVLIINWAVHEECPHEMELGTLKRFSKNVCPHIFGWAVF